MKHLLTLLLLPLALFGAPPAAHWEEAQAQAKAQSKDVAVLLDGSDWSHLSRSFREQVVGASAVQQALATEFIRVTVDNPEKPDDAGKALVEKNKGFGFRPWNLPALALSDEQGRVYASIAATEVADAPALLKRLQTAREARKTMREFLATAATLKGKEKAEALGRALNAIELNHARAHFGDLVREIAALDPNDSTGWRLRYEFNDLGFLEGTVLRLVGEKKLPEALKEIDQRLANTKISPDQRMRLFAARFAALRRAGQMTDALAVLDAMAAAEPESFWGKGARVIHAFHHQPVKLRGWFWEGYDMRPEPTPMEIEASDKVTAAGDYLIETKGWGLHIRSVALVAGDKVLAQTDRRQGDIWKLKLNERPAGEIRLRLTANGQGWYDGRGTIELRRE